MNTEATKARIIELKSLIKKLSQEQREYKLKHKDVQRQFSRIQVEVTSHLKKGSYNRYYYYALKGTVSEEFYGELKSWVTYRTEEERERNRVLELGTYTTESNRGLLHNLYVEYGELRGKPHIKVL